MSRRMLLRVAVLLVLVAVIVGIYLSPVRESLTRENVRVFVEDLRGLWYGPIVFILAFTVACIFALPASVFVLAAGLIWGWQLGGVYAMVGGLAGALASFYLGRFIGEGILHKFCRVGQMVIRQVDHAGFRSLFVLRSVPGIPFAVLNYGAGAAGVRARDFFFATLIGMAPSMFVFAYCADALFNGSMSEGDALTRLVVVCLLMLTVTLLPVALKRLARSTPQ